MQTTYSQNLPIDPNDLRCHCHDKLIVVAPLLDAYSKGIQPSPAELDAAVCPRWTFFAPQIFLYWRSHYET